MAGWRLRRSDAAGPATFATDQRRWPPDTLVEMPPGMGDQWDHAVTEAVCNLIESDDLQAETTQ